MILVISYLFPRLGMMYRAKSTLHFFIHHPSQTHHKAQKITLSSSSTSIIYLIIYDVFTYTTIAITIIQLQHYVTHRNHDDTTHGPAQDSSGGQHNRFRLIVKAFVTD